MKEEKRDVQLRRFFWLTYNILKDMANYKSNQILIKILTFEKIRTDTNNAESIILVPNGKARYVFQKRVLLFPYHKYFSSYY